MENKLIKIDGSFLEGGGQIVRSALALSAITGKPFSMDNIRAGRKVPGLQAQHLSSIKLLTELCNARVQGDRLTSREFVFYPSKPIKNSASYDVGTAGSVALVLQAVLPYVIFQQFNKPTQVELIGGTNVDMAPQIDYIELVLKPMLAKMGIHFDIEIIWRGLYPRGGGRIFVTIHPLRNAIRPIMLTNPGTVKKVQGRALVTSKLPIRVANTLSKAAENNLREFFGGDSVPICMESLCGNAEKSARNSGSAIVLACELTNGAVIGGSALGSAKETVEETASRAVNEILESLKLKINADHHLQDQLILFMALANGDSQILTGPLTLHTQTVIHVVEQFVPVKFETVEGDQTTIIKCKGIGWAPTNHE